MQIYVDGVKEVRKVDEHTVDFILAGPDPVLLRKLTDFRIMRPPRSMSRCRRRSST